MSNFINTNSGQNVYAPGLKARGGNQNARIRDGVQSGSIERGEAAVLRAQRNSIERQLDRAKSDDGVVGPVERRALHARANNASQTIFNFKHN